MGVGSLREIRRDKMKDHELRERIFGYMAGESDDFLWGGIKPRYESANLATVIDRAISRLSQRIDELECWRISQKPKCPKCGKTISVIKEIK